MVVLESNYQVGLTGSMSKLSLPFTLADFRDFHADETILVCGCGSSLNELKNPEKFITIGVNDVGRKFDPTYLVVLNPRQQFKNNRFRYVEQSHAKAIFTQLNLGIQHPHIVRFKLGKRGGTDFSNPNVLNYTRNSPYVALCLAIHMGAKRVGLIGIDFTDHHFFSRSGKHPLMTHLTAIDNEYKKLAKVCEKQGIEIINLSKNSRLSTFPKKTIQAFNCQKSQVEESDRVISTNKRIFLVHYQFLSCGNVITKGLEDAVSDLKMSYMTASCDDPSLPEKVKAFSPDLLLVIHGRKFRQLWGNRFYTYNTAVWLVDEPYEVDDTVKTSRLFDTVFLNDPSTLAHHNNSHYLPLAYNHHIHYQTDSEKKYDVGFIGGYNSIREKYLLALADAGLLSYIAGGPWKSAKLRSLCLSKNIPPEETSQLYQETRIVINVFRERHHFNKQKVKAYSLNPRVYEALACGAVVVSEKRSEMNDVFPLIPQFDSTEQLVSIVSDLLANHNQYQKILDTCLKQLPSHNYQERLQKIMETTLPQYQNSIQFKSRQNNFQEPEYTYSILMVVHNGLAMVQLSILRTLRFIMREKARLVVVDNASNDGTEQWLAMLAKRGDIDLIRQDKNIGHGPGLEIARQTTSSPFIVTLDSDAFPLTQKWLSELRLLLKDKVRIAGIGHHRGYIHPSCLMIARDTLQEFNLSFLNEKDKPSKLDVAERISVDVKRRGYHIAALKRTGEQRRGSASEPVYLGSQYGGLVYHQWYTTRAVLTDGQQVDDVPTESIELSLQELFDGYKTEKREITVVMGLRVSDKEPERLRNAAASLKALNYQSIERWRYRIIVVEQDTAERCKERLAPLTDEWIFVKNPGAYNRGWGFNIGACQAGDQSGILCLIDADILVPNDFLQRALEMMSSGVKAIKPYDEINYLDHGSTLKVIKDHSEPPFSSYISSKYMGQLFKNSQGGCIWVNARLYLQLNGHNEDFRGWGREDREFWDRLSKSTKITTLHGTLFHLYHLPAQQQDHWAKANRGLYSRLQTEKASRKSKIGQENLYASEELLNKPDDVPGYREWENWYRWQTSRLDRIVENERHLNAGDSDRNLLAVLLREFGDKILDLGCGPGALRLRLETQHPHAFYVGVDITQSMLQAARKSFENAALCRADAGCLPFKDASFDAVLLRHVLEHVPAKQMQKIMNEAIRVSCQAVIVAFYIAPSCKKKSNTRIVGENFLETCWNQSEIEKPIKKLDWMVNYKLESNHLPGESVEVWIVTPKNTKINSKALNIGKNRRDKPLKISIVIPTYQRAHTLLHTIKMIIKQTYRHWELIIIDNYGDVEYVPDDPRIKIYRHIKTASSSYARNMGIKYVTGDLVCFFDDDDDMYPDYLESFINVFNKYPNAKMVRCGMIVSNNTTNYSYATPECCVRKEYVSPSWDDMGPSQDQRYFKKIVNGYRWSVNKGDIVVIRKALCRANADTCGGLRSGNY